MNLERLFERLKEQRTIRKTKWIAYNIKEVTTNFTWQPSPIKDKQYYHCEFIYDVKNRIIKDKLYDGWECLGSTFRIMKSDNTWEL